MLNRDLEKIHQWLLANKLSLNVDKTEYMIIASRSKLLNIDNDLTVQLNGTDVKKVTSVKTLGVIIDECMLWNDQIDNVAKKASKGIGMMKRAKPFIPNFSLIALYKSVVQPHFEYCSSVWGNCSKSLQDKLQKLQNRAARVVTGDNYEVRSKEVLIKLNWQPLNQRRDKQLVTLVHGVITGKLSNIKNSLELMSNTRYPMRSNNTMIKLAKPRTNALKKCFNYRGAKLWNNLPYYLKNENISMQSFKNNLKNLDMIL